MESFTSQRLSIRLPGSAIELSVDPAPESNLDWDKPLPPEPLPLGSLRASLNREWLLGVFNAGSKPLALKVSPSSQILIAAAPTAPQLAQLLGQNEPFPDFDNGESGHLLALQVTVETTGDLNSPSLPVPSGTIDASLWGGETTLLRVVAVVPKSLPARQQLEQLFHGWVLPWFLHTTEDLSPGRLLELKLRGRLQFSARANLGYRLHWIRRLQSQRLEGDLGIDVQAPVSVRAEVKDEGAFSFRCFRESHDAVRIQFLRDSQDSFRAGASVEIIPEPKLPAPEYPTQLFRALAGLHPFQWIDGLIQLLETRTPLSLLKQLQIDIGEIEAVLKLWSGLSSWQRELLWRATENHENWQLLRAASTRAANPVELALADSQKSWLLTLARQPLQPELLSQQVYDVFHRLHQYFDQTIDSLQWLGRLRTREDFLNLDPVVRMALESFTGQIRYDSQVQELLKLLDRLFQLEQQVYIASFGDLRDRLTFSFAYTTTQQRDESLLLDISLKDTPGAFKILDQVFSGDWSGLFTSPPPGVVVHWFSYVYKLLAENKISVKFPFTDRREWKQLLEARGSLQVLPAEDGHLLVCRLNASSLYEEIETYQSVLALAGALQVGLRGRQDSFRLSYSDRRKLHSAQLVEHLGPVLYAYQFPENLLLHLRDLAEAHPNTCWDTSLVIEVPGEFVSAWLEGPAESDKNFFEVYSRVSVAIQRAMRQWVPYCYFSDPKRYETLAAAYPLLVYEASRPFPGQNRVQLTYDVMSKKSVSLALRCGIARLAILLARSRAILLKLGNERVANFYKPSQAREVIRQVRRQPRLFQSLLAADAFLVEQIVKTAVSGVRARRLLNEDPVKAVQKLTAVVQQLTKNFHTKLKRLYANEDFLPFGSLILVEATAALHHEIARPDTYLNAYFRLRPASDQPDGQGWEVYHSRVSVTDLLSRLPTDSPVEQLTGVSKPEKPAAEDFPEET